MSDRHNCHLLVDFTVTVERPLPELDRVRSLLSFAAASEHIRGELGIWLCSDSEIADLHQRFMNIPGATDVITFPGDDQYLGDIAVSVETAAVQARDVGVAPEREIAYLCLHGLLHIAGYDDLSSETRDKMIARQDSVFAEFEQEHPDEW